MDFHLIMPIFVIVVLINGSNGAIPGEVYWKSKLPNTQMPKALQELLQFSGNRSGFVELDESNFDPFRATYDVAYWATLSQAENENSIQNNATIIFFPYNDLHPNKSMNLIFTKSPSKANFLPQKAAKSIPFSSQKLDEIFHNFSIKPTSKQAQIMKQTIEQCEAPNIKGENKFCATSFESLVDFVVTKFGNSVQVFTNEVEEENKKQEYTILKGIKMVSEDQIICHKQAYKYAIFYCHKIDSTKFYMVPMVGVDGSKAKAVVVCHFHTSTWNPNHIAFHLLRVKPGGSPICHFLNSDTIVWVPKL